MRQEGRAGQFWRWEGTGSAENTWCSWDCARKSLILEATAAMHASVFAINSPRFAMSSIFAIGRPAPFFSLSKLLKEKEKESEEEREIGRIGPPLVESVLPPVTDAAYFLCHEFRESEVPNSWQLMATNSFEINALYGLATQTTYPRVALRVLPLRASPGK